MYKRLALIILCAAFSSCDSSFEVGPQDVMYYPAFVQWTHTNSAFYSLVRRTINTGLHEQETIYIIYKYSPFGTKLREYYTVPAEVTGQIDAFYIAENGAYCMLSFEDKILYFNTVTGEVVFRFYHGKLLSKAPDQDRFIIYANPLYHEESYEFWESDTGGAHKLKKISLASRSTSDVVPLYLANGKSAFLTNDRSNGDALIILDSLFTIQHVLRALTDVSYNFSLSAAAHANSVFARTSQGSYLINTETGEIDTLSFSDVEAPFQLTHDGRHVVYHENGAFVKRDVLTGETSILMTTARTTVFALSGDSKKMIIAYATNDPQNLFVSYAVP